MIKINLLPPELEASKKNAQRKNLINQLSISLLSLVILIAIGTIIYGRYQSSHLGSSNDKLTAAKESLSSLSAQESALLSTKSLLSGITTVSQKDYNQLAIYTLISSFLDPQSKLMSFSIDKKNKVNLSLEASSSASLQSFFDNLTSPTTNQGKLNKINIDSLSQASNNKIRFEMNFAINSPGSATKTL
jgi:hypothetical protein